jgi:tetratricopeptide (TPR) repeat protein
MAETIAAIERCEEQIEEAMWSLEMEGEIEEALAVYRDVGAKLEALGIAAGHPAYDEQQRVMAYCLMRQGNILRQLGQAQEAMALSEQEIAAARASGDEIALARSLMSNGANHIVAGGIEKGLALLEEARTLFTSGDSHDHRQGLGWHWILQAELANVGLVPEEPEAVIEMVDLALAVLLPLENWPGVARAYATRAQAYEHLGDGVAAAADRKAQQQYEAKAQGDGERP